MGDVRGEEYYPIASEDDKFIALRLDHRLGRVWMTRHQILHVRITQSSCHGEDAIDPIVENQATGVDDPLAFILVAALMIIRQSERLSIATKDNASVSHIGRVEHSSADRRIL